MQKLSDKISSIPKGYFSLMDLRKISQLKDKSLKVVLSRLVKSGKVTKLGQKFYTLDPQKIELEKFAIQVYAQSYVSFESALARQGILSQQPYQLTLATRERTKTIKTPQGELVYHHLKGVLYWGFIQKEGILMAESEKAFLDLAYLSLNGYAKFDPEEMSLNLLDRSKLKKYLAKFGSKKLKNLLLKNALTAKLLR
ncbi:MAG: hypothetical protein WCJ51_03225 [Candidatus Moraniibacteriota bacterium]